MEQEFIQWLRENLPPHPLLRLGVGDDAALLSLANATDCVVTADLLAEGVHFRIEEHAIERIGHKALGVNLSDLAAMAARPLAVVCTIALPRDNSRSIAQKLYAGMLPLAEQHGVAIAGGDTNVWDGPLVISVTAIGAVTERGPLLRSGGRSGDRLLVTGALGGSRAGRHLDVEPRIAEALLLNERYELHAGIDISDGLALDLSRLAGESGCGAILDLDHIPIAEAAKQIANESGASADAIHHALGDGEDFELLVAVAPGVAQQIVQDQPLDVPITDVGEFVDDAGLWQRDTSGEVTPLEPRGYVHR
jgi:thiamine-monophosphate kinase